MIVFDSPRSWGLQKIVNMNKGLLGIEPQIVSSGEDVTKVLIMTPVYKTHPIAKLRRFRQCQVVIK